MLLLKIIYLSFNCNYLIKVVLDCEIIRIVLTTEHNREVSSDNLTDLFREIAELLYEKYDTASCGGRTCEIPLRSDLSKYIYTSSTNILATASCLMLQSAYAKSNVKSSW